MRGTCREIQRQPLPLPAHRQAARGCFEVDPRVRIVQLIEQNVRRSKRGVTAKINFGQRGKPA